MESDIQKVIAGAIPEPIEIEGDIHIHVDGANIKIHWFDAHSATSIHQSLCGEYGFSVATEDYDMATCTGCILVNLSNRAEDDQ